MLRRAMQDQNDRKQKQKCRSRKQEAGSRKQGAGSRKQGAGAACSMCIDHDRGQIEFTIYNEYLVFNVEVRTR